jgi:hypothetical protein
MMNERIKELELEAYVEYTRMERDPPSGYMFERTGKEFSREKFAELIVKECVNVIRADYVDFGTTAAVNNIEKHFGVK